MINVATIKKSLVFLLLLLINVSALAAEERQTISSEEIVVPSNSSDFKGENYADVVRELTDAGFVNVHSIAMSDLLFGLLTKEGEVETVSIDGITEYEKDVSVPPDAEIIVKYHSFPFDISVPFDSCDYYADGTKYYYDLNWTVEELVDHFKSLGFNDITVEEQSSGDFEYYKIRRVSIDGDWRYEKGDIYKSNDSIKIVVNQPNETLTVDNCPELAAFLSGEDKDYLAFAEKYDGCIIEFDGHVAYSTPGSTLYEPIVDVAGGDFDNPYHLGHKMRIETTDLGIDNNYVWAYLDEDTNVHVIAEVEEYRSDYYKQVRLIGIVFAPQEEWNGGLLLPINRDF